MENQDYRVAAPVLSSQFSQVQTGQSVSNVKNSNHVKHTTESLSNQNAMQSKQGKQIKDTGVLKNDTPSSRSIGQNEEYFDRKSSRLESDEADMEATNSVDNLRGHWMQLNGMWAELCERVPSFLSRHIKRSMALPIKKVGVIP